MNYKQLILEEIDIKNTSGLSILIDNSTTVLRMLNSMELDNPVLEFRVPKFLKGLKALLNEVPANKIPEVVVHILQTCFKHLGIELTDQECFVLYQLRDLGKFRLKDAKLLQDLEKQFGQFPQYKVDKTELKHVLYELKAIKLIDVRRGSITLTEQITIHM